MSTEEAVVVVEAGLSATVLAENFAQAMKIATRVTSQAGTLPVLSCVLIEAQGDQIHIHGNNLSMLLSTSVAAKVSVPGAVAVPAVPLREVLSRMSDQVIVSLESDGTLRVRDETREAIFKTLPADEFPVKPSVDSGWRFVEAKVDPAKWLTGWRLVEQCQDRTESRPVLNGIQMTIPNRDAMTIVATDGFRLAKANLPVVSLTGSKGYTKQLAGIDVQLHQEIVAELSRLMTQAKKDEEEIRLTVWYSANKGEPTRINRVAWAFGSHISVITEVQRYTYPDYSQVIPKKADFQLGVTVPRAEMRHQLALVNVFARESAGTLKISPQLTTGEEAGKLQLRATSSETGHGAGEVEAVVEGSLDVLKEDEDSRFLALRLDYVKVPFDLLDSAEVLMQVVGYSQPVMFWPSGDDTMFCLVMPMSMGK